MHAVLVTVSIDPNLMDEAQAALTEEVVPLVSSAPGLVAAYWMDPKEVDGGLRGNSIAFFDSEAAAQGMAAGARQMPVANGVAITDVEVRAVSASV